MRRLIPASDIPKMTLEDKYHIISAYMRAGGVQGLIGDHPDHDEVDLTEEEKLTVEEEFDKLYSTDLRFKSALEGTQISNLGIRDKYELIISYSK